MTESRFATLTFEREIAAPAATVWHVWTSPAARAIWSAPTPEVTIEVLEADPRVGGRERSLCKVAGQPDIHVEGRWLDMVPDRRSVNDEVVSCEGHTQSVALVTAEIADHGAVSRLRVTVHLVSLGEDMQAGYRQGFSAGLDNLRRLAERSMVLERMIRAPVSAVWGSWMNPGTLPQWWGPDGFSCRTSRIDLREGGDWVFDMIGPDGTVFPNHHRFTRVRPEERIEYTLHWGENGPKHADASASFDPMAGATRVTLCLFFQTRDEFEQARGFGAVELGLQTLGKLARSVGAD